MTPTEEIRSRLMKACDDARSAARSQDRGSMRPDPSKLVAEGIAAGRGSIEATPLDPDPARYLSALRTRLDELRVSRRKDSTTQDGHDDEDGYVLGGLATVAGLIERETESRRGWWAGFKHRIFGR